MGDAQRRADREMVDRVLQRPLRVALIDRPPLGLVGVQQRLLGLSSWAGRTPLDHQSGKRTGRARHKKGNKYPGAITGETAVAAGKTQTREGARYRLIYLSHWRRGFWQC